MRTLKVAAVQATSTTGRAAENLRRAEALVAEAARRGAELVLCPEFLAAGYVFHERIWEGAEPEGGATETWLGRVARAFGVHVGATFLEADGDQFFNTFSLYGPSGRRLGRVRKGSLPFFEGWYFAKSDARKVIDTDLGRIGVGICNDNQTSWFFRHMAEEQPDVLLMPHSAPTPKLPIVASMFRKQLGATAAFYAAELGVPVVLANKASSRAAWTPIPLVPGARVPIVFEGYSSIHDGGGRPLAASVGHETVLVADVRLDPARKRTPRDLPSGYWARRPAVLPRAMGAMLDALDALGRRAYAKNPRRAERARAQSSVVASCGPTRDCAT